MFIFACLQVKLLVLICHKVEALTSHSQLLKATILLRRLLQYFVKLLPTLLSSLPFTQRPILINQIPIYRYKGLAYSISLMCKRNKLCARQLLRLTYTWQHLVNIILQQIVFRHTFYWLCFDLVILALASAISASHLLLFMIRSFGVLSNTFR